MYYEYMLYVVVYVNSCLHYSASVDYVQCIWCLTTSFFKLIYPVHVIQCLQFTKDVIAGILACYLNDVFVLYARTYSIVYGHTHTHTSQ